jgi:HK97 family phage portal protein
MRIPSFHEQARQLGRKAQRLLQRAAGAAVKTIERVGLAALGRRVAGWWFSPTRNSKEWLQEMGANALLYTVTNRIGTDISGVEWHVFRRNKKNPKQREEVDFDHPLVKVLEQPNDWHTGEELMYLIEVYLDLCGEAFLMMIRDDAGLPAQLLPLPPHWIETTPTRAVPGYMVIVRDKLEFVPRSEIIWIKNPHPFEPYGRGLGTAAALDNQVSQAKSADLHNLNFFRRNARPDVVVSVPDADQDQLQRLKDDWRTRHSGVIDQWEPEFINAESKVQLLTQTLKDMDFVNLRKSIRDTVYQVYGVPPEVLGCVENSNRATADLAIYLYTLLVLTPRLKRIRAALQRGLVAAFGDPLLVLDFESPVRETAEFLLKMAGELFTRAVICRDEARKIVGMPPVGGELGQEFLQPVNVVAIDRDGSTIVTGPNQSQQQQVVNLSQLRKMVRGQVKAEYEKRRKAA